MLGKSREAAAAVDWYGPRGLGRSSDQLGASTYAARIRRIPLAAVCGIAVNWEGESESAWEGRIPRRLRLS